MYCTESDSSALTLRDFDDDEKTTLFCSLSGSSLLERDAQAQRTSAIK